MDPAEGVAPTLEAKPVVAKEDDLYGHTDEVQTLLAEKIEALAISPITVPRPSPRKFLTRPAKGRVPFTSDKFDIVGYVNKVLDGTSQIYVQYILRCEFVCKDDTGYPTDFKEGPGAPFVNEKEFETLYEYADAVKGYHDELDSLDPRGVKPAIGLIRLVWPSPAKDGTLVHHIIPYFMNNAGPDGKRTIWFLEQYDTTFWWLFNERVRNWHIVLGQAMIGEGHNYIRAYVPAADAISRGKKIKYASGVAKDFTGYAMDLQRGSNGKSSETCVPWSMVILKYITNPKSVGVDKDQLVLETLKQEDFNEMYRILNAGRDTVLMWVQDTVRGGKRRKTHRRRRQTRRKTKRSRK